jgi:hypothetical protein
MGSNFEEVVVENNEGQEAWRRYRESGLPELLANFNLVHVIFAFVDTGIAARLQQDEWATSEALLEGLNADLGRNLLRYLAIRGVLEEKDGRYRLSPRGQDLISEASFAQLGFYCEAYGPVVSQIAPLLRGEGTYGKDVLRDGEALGRHCGVAFQHFGTAVALRALEEMGVKSVLDLGCGSGAFLIDACKRNSELRAVGLDISSEAIEWGRRQVEEAGLSDRIKLVVADAFRPDLWPPVCSEPEAIMTAGTLHELFRDGEQAVIDLLNRYADYMVAEGTKGMILAEPELLMNDKDADFFLVHAATAQGFPRPRGQWLELFPKTRLHCRRVLSAEDVGPPFAYFELVVR